MHRVVLAALALLSAGLPPEAAGPRPLESTSTVDCDAGESIGRVLRRLELRPDPGPARIEIHGICRENVRISNLTVSLHGASPGAAIEGLPGQGFPAAVQVRNADLRISNLAVRNGQGGGVLAFGSTLAVIDSTIAQNRFVGVGLSDSEGAIERTTVHANDGDGIAMWRSNVVVTLCEIAENRGAGPTGGLGSGLRISGLSTGSILGGTIRGNFVGVTADAGSRLAVQIGGEDPVAILDNEYWAAISADDAKVTIFGPEIFGDVAVLDGAGLRIESAVLHGNIELGEFGTGVVTGGATVVGAASCDATSDLLCRDAAVEAADGCDSCLVSVDDAAEPRVSPSTRIDRARRFTRPLLARLRTPIHLAPASVR